MQKNFPPILSFILTIWIVIASLNSKAVEDIGNDIEHIVVYGTYYPMDIMWLKLEFESLYRYQNFLDDYVNVDEQQALRTACQAVLAKKPNGCYGKPTALATPRTNGCSIPGGYPYESWKTSFEGACNNHDVCYDNITASKSFCDGKFSLEMDEVCDVIVQSAKQKQCYSASGTYYSGVVIGAIGAYYTNQTEANCAAWWSSFDETCGKLTSYIYKLGGWMS
ncbi:hypothetical protein [Neptunicella sp.]|uniref:hypothetical protein n=1 Tax=Neptunicella sp. TaxID=2125986 RepID=UPI003F68CED0